MKNVEETLKGIYRDLRNQRLLPVVAVLIVAIIAVPIALGAGSKEAVPQTQLAVGIEPLTDTEPVVLASTPELRNFHKRLNKFAQKNPFHQPKAPAGPKSDKTTQTTDTGVTTQTTDTGATGTGTTDTGTTDTGTTDTGSTGTGTTDTGSTGTGSTDTGSTDTGSTGTGTGGSDTGSSGAELISYRIDVLVGAVGEEQEMNDVKSLDLLPGDSHPVLQYVTSDIGGNSATFIVSNSVTNADGDGKCAPSRFDCEFLRMEPGDSEKFEYGPTSRTYRIKLLAINQHADPLDSVGKAASDVSGRIGFSAGLPSADTVFTPAG